MLEREKGPYHIGDERVTVTYFCDNELEVDGIFYSRYYRPTVECARLMFDLQSTEGPGSAYEGRFKEEFELDEEEWLKGGRIRNKITGTFYQYYPC